eukprot:6185402-Pleurochrysis_carterae.AAC.1
MASAIGMNGTADLCGNAGHRAHRNGMRDGGRSSERRQGGDAPTFFNRKPKDARVSWKWRKKEKMAQEGEMARRREMARKRQMARNSEKKGGLRTCPARRA